MRPALMHLKVNWRGQGVQGWAFHGLFLGLLVGPVLVRPHKVCNSVYYSREIDHH